MIELTLEQLINSANELQKLSTKPLKAKGAFIIAKILKAADAEISNFNDTRLALINKYGAKNEDGMLATDENNNVKIMDEYLTQFQSELHELLETNITFSINKIPVSLLEELEFTPQEIILLEPFVDLE